MIVAVPCLQDNYAYLIEDGDGGAVVVDPSEAGPVQRALAHRGLTLRGIWNTHHHWDHVGGNDELAHPDLDIVCSRHDQARVPRASKCVGEEARWQLGPASVRLLEVPGHTLGAVAYVLEEQGQARCVFTGDTLFSAGCGRLFEGTAAQMHASLQKLVALGDEVLVFVGHEYTVKNLQFALSLEPERAELLAALADAEARRARNLPTVPTQIGHERRINPFLRVHERSLRQALGLAEQASEVEVFAALRARRNDF